MRHTTLIRQVKAYLDEERFLAAGHGEGLDAEFTASDAEHARRALLERLDGWNDPSDESLVAAIRGYLNAELKYERCEGDCDELTASARDLEQARLALREAMHASNHHGRESSGARHSPVQMRILVALGAGVPSEFAVEVGASLAEKLSAELMLLRVVIPHVADGGEFGIRLEYVNERDKEEALELLRRTRAMLPASLACQLSVRQGAPAEEIVKAAREWGAHLIVVGTRGHGRLRRFLLGSTAEAVIRSSECPVISVKSRAEWACVSPLRSERTAAVK